MFSLQEPFIQQFTGKEDGSSVSGKDSLSVSFVFAYRLSGFLSCLYSVPSGRNRDEPS